MTLCIDLNADVGEGMESDAALLSLVTSANVTCGIHAGDPFSIRATVREAQAAGVAVGAHPSLQDREGFGRRELPTTPEEIFVLVVYQIGAFAAVAATAGVCLRHVKPHGALYNMAARDSAIATATAQGIVAFDRSLLLFAPPGSELSRAGEAHGLQVIGEFFADREYLPDGSLVPRTRADAVIHEAGRAVERVLRMVRENVVKTVDGVDIPLRAGTVCIHGDHPEAVAFAIRLRAGLLDSGISVKAPGPNR